MNLRSRKRWSLFLLLVGLPAWIVVVVSVVNWAEARFGEMPFALGLVVYVVLGVVWIVPFRRVFVGIGQGEE